MAAALALNQPSGKAGSGISLAPASQRGQIPASANKGGLNLFNDLLGLLAARTADPSEFQSRSGDIAGQITEELEQPSSSPKVQEQSRPSDILDIFIGLARLKSFVPQKSPAAGGKTVSATISVATVAPGKPTGAPGLLAATTITKDSAPRFGGSPGTIGSKQKEPPHKQFDQSIESPSAPPGDIGRLPAPFLTHFVGPDRPPVVSKGEEVLVKTLVQQGAPESIGSIGAQLVNPELAFALRLSRASVSGASPRFAPPAPRDLLQPGSTNETAAPKADSRMSSGADTNSPMEDRVSGPGTVFGATTDAATDVPELPAHKPDAGPKLPAGFRREGSPTLALEAGLAFLLSSQPAPEPNTKDVQLKREGQADDHFPKSGTAATESPLVPKLRTSGNPPPVPGPPAPGTRIPARAPAFATQGRDDDVLQRRAEPLRSGTGAPAAGGPTTTVAGDGAEQRNLAPKHGLEVIALQNRPPNAEHNATPISHPVANPRDLEKTGAKEAPHTPGIRETRADVDPAAVKANLDFGSKEIVLRLSSAAADKVDVRLLDRGGELHVAVRTSNAGLTAEMRSQISDLVGRIQQTGLNAEVWSPQTEAAASKPPTGSQPDNSHEQERQPGGREPGSQGHGGEGRQQRQKPRWVAILQETNNAG